MRKKLNPLTTQEAHKRYMGSDELTIAEVAEQIGVHVNTLATHFAKLGLQNKQAIHRAAKQKGEALA